MSDLHFAANATAATRITEHGGKTYLVAPVVALREGVLNDVLVLASEFGKHFASWNGRPVALRHPQDESGYISANSPDLWHSQVPGHLWNVRLDNDKLAGEIWIDLAKAQSLGDSTKEVITRLQSNLPVEVSTGYFADTETSGGLHNGKSYSGIARHITPDHLALLPDEQGACSWADGCGTPRVNSQEEPMENPIDSTVPSPNERGLFDRFLGWLRQSKDEESMNKNELIAQLVANKQCKLPKERLEKWEEADLAAFAESLAVHEEEAAPATPTEPAQSSATPTMPPEFTQFLDAVRGIDMGKLKEALGAISANADHERSVLIADIKANERNSFDDGELSAMPTAQLRKLQSSLLPRDYSLAGGYFRTHAGGDEYELAMPDAWPKKEG